MKMVVAAVAAMFSVASVQESKVQVPMALRPNTLQITKIDAEMDFWMASAMQVFSDPTTELAVCFTGTVKDSILTDLVVHRAILLAASDSTVSYACDSESVGIGHSHVRAVTPNEICVHSNTDVRTLAESYRLLSVVFCANGQTELLMQDGRRVWFPWHSEEMMLDSLKPAQKGS